VFGTAKAVPLRSLMFEIAAEVQGARLNDNDLCATFGEGLNSFVRDAVAGDQHIDVYGGADHPET
jgi:hypothetical protein